MAYKRWTLTYYAHFWVGNTLHINATTDRACHMWVRYTFIPPVLDQRAEAARGLKKMTNPKYCFVEWTEVEQTQPGDTLNHSFQIPGWTPGIHIWWHFIATIDGDPTTSNTAIFTAEAYEQGSAFTMQHIDLTAKDPAGIIDHADGSVTPAKLATPFTFTAFPLTPSASPAQDYEVANKEYVDISHNEAKWLSTHSLRLVSIGLGSTTAWAELDLSAILPSGTMLAYLTLYMEINSIGFNGEAKFRVRNPNQTTNRRYLPALWMSTHLGHRSHDEHAMQYFVGPTTARKIEWKVDITGTINIDIRILLEGYYYYTWW